jgi:hypothetical protein
MKKLLTFTAFALLFSAVHAQDTTRVHKTTTYDSSKVITQPNNGNNNNNNTNPNYTTPPPAPTPAPAPAPENTGDNDHHGNMTAKLLLGVRFMPTWTALKFRQTSEGNLSTTAVVGYGYGGLVGIQVNNYFSITLEAMYNSLAQKYSQGNVSREVRLNYVNLPLMFFYNTNFSQKVNFNIGAGPQLGISTGHSYTVNGNNQGDTANYVLAVKPADWGLAYGFGLDFSISQDRMTKLSVGYRGVVGLVDVSDNSNNQVTNNQYILDRSHVNTYSVYIGLTHAF